MNDPTDDVDQRFRELIRAEFGDVAGAREPGAAEPPPLAPPPVRRRLGVRKLRDPIEYFNLSEEIEKAEPDEDFERWNPPADEPLPRPPARVIIGLLLLLGTVIVAVAVLAGLRPELPVAVTTMVCFGAGLGLLLSALPRHRRSDGDGTAL